MVILITGASRGIGAALAMEFAKNHCAQFILTARTLDALNDTAQKVRDLGSQCLCLAADATNPEQSEAVINQIVQQFNKIDLAILNVGGAKPALTHQLSVSEISTTIQQNFGTCINFFVPLQKQMKEQGFGHIAHVNSLASFLALPKGGHYSTAKMAVRYFLDAAREELAAWNINITILCPGFVDTDSQQHNPNPKPFLLSPQQAAKKMYWAIRRKKRLYAFPWQLALGIRFLKILPYFLKHWIFQRILK